MCIRDRCRARTTTDQGRFLVERRTAQVGPWTVRRCMRPVDIILLYGILQITVLFYMCALFALGALHNFQISSGAKERAQGAAAPCYPAGAAHERSM